MSAPPGPFGLSVPPLSRSGPFPFWSGVDSDLPWLPELPFSTERSLPEGCALSPESEMLFATPSESLSSVKAVLGLESASPSLSEAAAAAPFLWSVLWCADAGTARNRPTSRASAAAAVNVVFLTVTPSPRAGSLLQCHLEFDIPSVPPLSSAACPRRFGSVRVRLDRFFGK